MERWIVALLFSRTKEGPTYIANKPTRSAKRESATSNSAGRRHSAYDDRGALPRSRPGGQDGCQPGQLDRKCRLDANVRVQWSQVQRAGTLGIPRVRDGAQLRSGSQTRVVEGVAFGSERVKAHAQVTPRVHVIPWMQGQMVDLLASRPFGSGTARSFSTSARGSTRRSHKLDRGLGPMTRAGCGWDVHGEDHVGALSGRMRRDVLNGGVMFLGGVDRDGEGALVSRLEECAARLAARDRVGSDLNHAGPFGRAGG